MMKKVAEMNKWLRIAGICGIIALILFIPFVAVEMLLDSRFGGVVGLPLPYLALYIVLLLAYAALGVVWGWGFVIIGRKLKNYLLEITSKILIALSLLILVLDIVVSIALPAEGLISVVYGFGMLFILGASSIPYGIALLRLNKSFGGIATAAGVLNIILGVAFATILLSPLGLLLLFPAGILEVLILFRASRELK